MKQVATSPDVAALRAEIEAFRTDMAKMHTTLAKWMASLSIGIVISIGLGIADLLVALLSS